MPARNETTRHQTEADAPDDPDVRTVPLEDDEGNEVVISQQNVGLDNEVGQGEFPDTSTAPKDPGEVAAEQAELDER